MHSFTSARQAWFLPWLLALPMVVGTQSLSSESLAVLPTASTPSTPRSPGSRQIEGDARIVHALERLTFGPRPGDISTVKAMGVEAWINQQLHPEKIDDSALEQQLKLYPAMQMTVKALMMQVPPPPLLRQIINGRAQMPQDETLQAVYQTQIAIIQMREQAQALKQADSTRNPPQQLQAADTQGQMGTASAPAATPPNASANPLMAQQGQHVSPTDPSLEDKKQQILADLQATGIVNLPPKQRIAKVLAMQPLERISFYRDLSLEDRLAFIQGLTPQQAQLFSAMFAPLRTIASQLEATKMLRVVDSNRQLQEVMTDFWFNHFNVDIRKGPLMPYYLAEYENKVLRPNALGNFEDLLDAVARSRAMLLYLDNASSVGPHSLAAMQSQRGPGGYVRTQPKRVPPGLNENYARELMELHTLGVNGGYTQQDVIEVARVFSGWTIEKPLQGGGFVFNPRRHEPGPKYVLGHTIDEHGEAEGLEVLHILATSPATAHHISEELAERFVSDKPSPALVNRMAQTFLVTHGDIRQVLRTMFFSPEFWAQSTWNAKVKTPLEFVASAARASDTQVEFPVVLALAVARLGMPLYACQPPTGYSMNADAWISSGSLVERMNFAMAFADNRLPGVVNHWNALLGPDAITLEPSQKESQLENILLHGDLSAKTHDAVLKDLVDAPVQTQPHPFPLGGAMQGYIVPTAEQTNADANAEPTPFRQPLPRDRQAALTAGLLIGSPDFQSR